jgi:hypothetical protein
VDADARAALARAYTHGPGKAVSLETAGAMGAPNGGGPGLALAAVAESSPFAASVVRVLRLALAPRRWEPWNAHNDHRAYPSPRAAFVVDVALLVDGRRWIVDPVRDRLCGPHARPAAVVAPGRVRLELAVCPGRLPASYGSLADALAHLEAGHVAGALVEAAAACGLTAHCSTVDDGVGRGPRGLEITLTVGTGKPGLVSRVGAVRTSGIGPRGLSVDPRPLPGSTVVELVRAVRQAPPGSPAHWSGLRHIAAVRGVTDVDDGVYDVSGAAARLRSAGNVMADVQAAFTYAPSAVATAGMNVAWVMTGAVAEAVRAAGPSAYDRLLVTAGAAAQHIGTAAAEMDLFCRPCRSVREAPLEAVVAAPADQDFVYLLLIGRSRLRDFPYLLTRPEARP